MDKFIDWFQDIGLQDVDRVGLKSAWLGELYDKPNLNIPNAFVLNDQAYQQFLQYNQLQSRIESRLNCLNLSDSVSLSESGSFIREWIRSSKIPEDIHYVLKESFTNLKQQFPVGTTFVLRASPIFSSMPERMKDGLNDTYFHCSEVNSLYSLVLHIYASLFSDRAIEYRNLLGLPCEQTKVSIIVQPFIRSDQACSGVMTTQHGDSGFDGVIFISSVLGMAERLLADQVNPDEFCVYKQALKENRPSIVRKSLGGKSKKLMLLDGEPRGMLSEHETQVVNVSLLERQRFSLTDEEITLLAHQAQLIEDYFDKPVKIEWAKDGFNQKMSILQVSPLILFHKKLPTVLERYLLKEQGQILLEGRSVGHKISSGKVKIIDEFREDHQLGVGDILVADLTDPDWEPLMKRASGIVTNRGGRTCHAAIIARELGIPAIVGCGDATEILTDGQIVTVSCAEGDTGIVYDGQLDFELRKNSVHSMPQLPVDIMMNVGNPDRAFDFQALPNKGVGLARLEFIINRMIGIHPKALISYQYLPPEVQRSIQNRINGYDSPIEFYVEKLVEGISTLGIAFASKRVIVRLSDFKSNEYANLIGGQLYEPTEENPMMGFRGAARYISESFKDCFELECRAIKRVREEIGLKNIEILVPFVRTTGQAKQVVDLLAENGLVRGENDLKIMMMCELPSNAILATEFLEYFDGFSIGSNDLAQLTLGLDRDSGIVAHLFDERNEAIKSLLKNAIDACLKAGKYVGICGQGPADHPELANWLVEQGVESISLSPDSVLETWFALADKKLK